MAKWSSALQARFRKLCKRSDCFLALWKSDKYGLPSNGGASDHKAQAGMIQEIPGPLQICTRNALHATLAPKKWKGERMWVVALFGEIQHQDDKCAALKREIIGEVPLGGSTVPE